jgi:lipid-A-disaccharide synthase
MKNLKIFLIAGEASGDTLGSKLMSSIKKHASVEFFGIGGPKMIAQGLNITSPMEGVGLIGLFEILPHLLKLISTIKSTAKSIDELKPDLVITIDSWDFCSRVVARIKSRKAIKRAHYISPTIWAYRKNRLLQIEKLYDIVLSIFPFESKYYEESNVKYKYIGHPLTETFSKANTTQMELANAGIQGKHNSSKRTKLTSSRNLYRWIPAFARITNGGASITSNTKIIGVMVGSRNGEVDKLLPVFVEAVNKFLDQVKDREKFLAVFPAVNENIANKIMTFQSKMKFKAIVIDASKLLEKDRISMLRGFDLALVKSGTSSLELTFAGVPMVVAYKLNYFSNLIARHVFQLYKKLKYASMTNILMGEEVIEEFLQEKCNVQDISNGLLKLLDPNYRKKLLLKYSKVVSILSNRKQKKPSDIAAETLLELVN